MFIIMEKLVRKVTALFKRVRKTHEDEQYEDEQSTGPEMVPYITIEMLFQDSIIRFQYGGDWYSIYTFFDFHDIPYKEEFGVFVVKTEDWENATPEQVATFLDEINVPFERLPRFPFLRLPSDIRDIIIKMAVVSDQPKDCTAVRPPFARVSKQLHTEVMRVNCVYNTFRVPFWNFSPENLSEWLRILVSGPLSLTATTNVTRLSIAADISGKKLLSNIGQLNHVLHSAYNGRLASGLPLGLQLRFSEYAPTEDGHNEIFWEFYERVKRARHRRWDEVSAFLDPANGVGEGEFNGFYQEGTIREDWV